jgi:hypothetical protein
VNRKISTILNFGLDVTGMYLSQTQVHLAQLDSDSSSRRFQHGIRDMAGIQDILIYRVNRPPGAITEVFLNTGRGL